VSVEGIVAVKMPKWGMAMEEGTLVTWRVSEGDRVKAGDVIAEVESTKVTGEIEAQQPGIVCRRVVSEGDVIAVGGLMAVISNRDIAAEVIDAFVAENAEDVQRKEVRTEGTPQSMTIDGRKIAYFSSGTGGIPAILVHGFGGGKDSWALTETELASQRPVIMLDLPGHGASDKDVGPGDIDMMGNLLSAFVSNLGIERAHFIGHSLGGAIALAFADIRPDKVASLNLIASAGLGEEINGDYVSGFASASRRRELKTLATELFADSSFVTNALLEELVRYKSTDGVSKALSQIVNQCFPDGKQAAALQKRAIARRVPSQTLWGSEDRIIPAAHAEGMDNVTIISGAGHMVHVEQPKTVNFRLAHFMAEIDNSSGSGQ
jgi:pyruvate dehydrogenase E2 component (dihydrolipoamide acetyltransferase)